MSEKVQKLLKEASTDMSLADLLDKADVSETDYVEALENSCIGSVVDSSVNLASLASTTTIQHCC